MLSSEGHSLNKLLDKLARSEQPPDEIQVCPACNGQLRVLFATYMRGNKVMMGGAAQCQNCGISIFADYYSVPAWARKIDDTQDIDLWTKLSQLRG